MPKDDEHMPLVRSTHFNYTDRPYRDRFWALMYLAVLGTAVVGGIYGLQHSNPLYEKAMNPDYMADPAHCPVDAGARRRLLEDAATEFDLGEFFSAAWRWLLLSAAASLALGAAYLHLMRRHAGSLIRLTIGLLVALPLAGAAGAAWATGRASAGGSPHLAAYGPPLFMAGLMAFTFYLWRDYFPLAARLISVSAEGLNANPGLLLFVLLEKLAGLAVLLAGVLAGVVAWTNGDVVPNPEREGGGQCVDAQGEGVPCCAWEPRGWVMGYVPLLLLACTWTVFLEFTVRLCVISGTIGQWYFAPATLDGGRASTRGTTLRSVRHAFGPSFGSLCFGSGVLTWVEMMRSAAENSQDGQSESLVMACLRGIASCLLQILEFLTKFAVVRLAITGESFMTAGRNASTLLARNMLKTVGVWWFPPLVTQMTAFVLAALWGGGMYGASYYAWRGRPQGVADAAVLGVLAGVVALAVLSYFMTVLLDCIDAVYMCYAMDMDAGHATRPEVHDVFAHIPKLHTGSAVQQPDGSVAYGQPSAQAGPYYAPPAQQYPYGAPGPQYAPPAVQYGPHV